jgi:hypothetical protein
MDTTTLISILTAVGFGSILTALIQYGLERKRQDRRLLFEARKVTYGKVLRALRTRSTDDDTIDLHGELAEATLLAGRSLREKLVKAANAFPDHWEIVYGADKSAALRDIERAMKKELGIR